MTLVFIRLIFLLKNYSISVVKHVYRKNIFNTMYHGRGDKNTYIELYLGAFGGL